jgi:hypothetical protein
MILLYWLALALFAVFGVVNFLFLWASTGKYPKGYFHQTAVNIDMFGNREFRALWNGTLISRDGEPFGNPRETISEVLGHNYVAQKLTRYGKVVVFLISPNHCLIAAGLADIKERTWVKVLRVFAWFIFPLLFLWATPHKLRIVFSAALAGTFGKLCNVYGSTLYLYIGMAFVFVVVIDVLWFIIKSLRQ